MERLKLNPAQNEAMRNLKDMYALELKAAPVQASDGGMLGNKVDAGKAMKLRKLVGSRDFAGEGSLEFYKMGQLLGQGATSKVYTAWHRLTGHKVAIKQYAVAKMERNAATMANVKNEVSMYKKLSHSGIVHLYESFQNSMYVCLVLEYLPNGTLINQLRKQKTFSANRKPCMTEEAAAAYILPIAQGLEHMHEKNIAHRDIKLDNIMLAEGGVPKIVDLGFGVPCTMHSADDEQQGNGKARPMCQQFGTPLYMAPEVWDRRYGKSADVWSLGVCLYTLVTGQYPYWGECEEDLRFKSKNLNAANYWIPEGLSPEARALINRMLCADAKERATAREVLGHPWFSRARATVADSGGGDASSLWSDSKARDGSLLDQMQELGFDRVHVLRALDADIRNHVTATYKMLFQQQRQRQAG